MPPSTTSKDIAAPGHCNGGWVTIAPILRHARLKSRLGSSVLIRLQLTAVHAEAEATRFPRPNPAAPLGRVRLRAPARGGKPCAARQRRRLRNSRTAPFLACVIYAYRPCLW